MIALLGLIVVLAGIIGAQVQFGKGHQVTPRLGLDLAGGTEIVLEPVPEGRQKVTPDLLSKAADIIAARINGTGIGEPEVTTSGNNVVVTVPGAVTEAQRKLIKQSSQLRFRPVLVVQPAQTAPAPTGTVTGPAPTPGASTPVIGPTPSAGPTGTATPAATVAPSSGTSTNQQRALPQNLLLAGGTTTPTTPAVTTKPTPPTPTGASTPRPKPTNASDQNWIDEKLAKQFQALTCEDTAVVQTAVEDPDKPFVTCSLDRKSKYILGPSELDGTAITNAAAALGQLQGGGTSTEWQVNLTFNSAGAKKFGEVTTRLYKLPEPTNRFAVELDKLVITDPAPSEPILGGNAQITGSYTQEGALELANQLKYGALPLSFKVQTEAQIAPLLGQEQLERGLLAGLIGLLLVVFYSLLQYRALGLVTVASLVIASVVTYEIVVVLSNGSGLRLQLAGITGLIVSIGVTADSFIVYFERVRDEVREGRSLRSAVETGWKRARRTILAADAINFLAAVVLFVLAAGGVQGFAYMLGLSTLIDVLIVFMFTHPLLSLLARTNFFGQGHRWSGLDPDRLGSGIAIGVKANIGTIASRRAAATAASTASTPRDV